MQEFIKQLELTLERDPDSINIKDAFRDYPEWDSLMVFAVLSMISDEYELEVSRTDFDAVKTVEELYHLVDSKKQ